MSDMKHTPGPWTYYDDTESTKRIEIVAMGKTVARIYHSVPEEDLPNARLLASAPELLEALEGLMEVERRGRLMPIGREWDAARAAIAKALGS